MTNLAEAWIERFDGTAARRPERWGLLVAMSSGSIHAMVDGVRWRLAPGHALWVPGRHRFEPLPEDRDAAACVVALNPHWTVWTDYRLLGCTPLLRQLLVSLSERGAVGEYDERALILARAAMQEMEQAWSIPLAPPVPRLNLTFDAARMLYRIGPEEPSIEEVAARLGTSRRTLDRMFREDLGMTAGGWRRSARMTEATRLLFHGVPLRLIARQTGYSDAIALSRAFQNQTGVTLFRYLHALGPAAFAADW